MKSEYVARTFRQIQKIQSKVSEHAIETSRHENPDHGQLHVAKGKISGRYRRTTSPQDQLGVHVGQRITGIDAYNSRIE